ncbi:MAG TPA: NAD(P)/FAD-dependent oxidoreductase [Thermodesulfovibrionales bacterium]|nr:NAD(P)/FAD-dependent oxidoreductase [Thermodesulfovibrionales bacterium]
MVRDIVVIGAGAAGLMCAIQSGKRGRTVIVLEHMGRIGMKIRVSGGGRCNFTNTNLSSDNYLSSNPHFCKSALARFTPGDFISMLERRRIAYYEKESGQLFCRGTSADIIGMFQEECRSTGVEIILNCRVGNISKTEGFRISTDLDEIEASSLVIATGGLSYPELGATGMGFRIAKKFGLKTTRMKPALVPLLFGRGDLDRYSVLSGVGLDALVRCAGRKFSGRILFTHRGLSGPAILQASSYWNKGDEIIIDLMPETDSYGLFMSNRRSRIEMANLLSQCLPRRFSHRWCEVHAPSQPLCRYSERQLRDISHQIHHWAITPSGTEGYTRAEITAGGVDTEELSSKTMEAKKVPGLFFAGEVIDVAGQLGGYNLQWAWSSGFVAGQYA